MEKGPNMPNRAKSTAKAHWGRRHKDWASGFMKGSK